MSGRGNEAGCRCSISFVISMSSHAAKPRDFRASASSPSDLNLCDVTFFQIQPTGLGAFGGARGDSRWEFAGLSSIARCGSESLSEEKAGGSNPARRCCASCIVDPLRTRGGVVEVH